MPGGEDVIANAMAGRGRDAPADIVRNNSALRSSLVDAAGVVDGVVKPQRQLDRIAIDEQRRDFVAKPEAIEDMVQIVILAEGLVVSPAADRAYTVSPSGDGGSDATLPHLREARRADSRGRSPRARFHRPPATGCAPRAVLHRVTTGRRVARHPVWP